MIPEKWCIAHYPEALKWIQKNAEKNGHLIYKTDYYYYPCDKNGNNSVVFVPYGYTEITFEEFKKYILKQETMKTKEEQLQELQATIETARKQIEELQKQPEPLETLEDCYNKVKPLYYIDENSEIDTLRINQFRFDSEQMTNLPSRKHCEQIQAIMKCMVVMEALNDGWKPDWKTNQYKWRFEMENGEYKEIDWSVGHIVSLFYFKTKELAEKAYTILGEETIKTAMGL